MEEETRWIGGDEMTERIRSNANNERYGYAAALCRATLLNEIIRMRPMLCEKGEANMKRFERQKPFSDLNNWELKNLVDLIARSLPMDARLSTTPMESASND